MLTPTIHLNGDTQEWLLDRATDALHSLRTARDEMLKLGPNGRNFYPQGAGVVQDAIKEFNAMIDRFDTVYDEIERYATAVADGGFKEISAPAAQPLRESGEPEPTDNTGQNQK